MEKKFQQTIEIKTPKKRHKKNTNPQICIRAFEILPKKDFIAFDKQNLKIDGFFKKQPVDLLKLDSKNSTLKKIVPSKNELNECSKSNLNINDLQVMEAKRSKDSSNTKIKCLSKNDQRFSASKNSLSTNICSDVEKGCEEIDSNSQTMIVPKFHLADNKVTSNQRLENLVKTQNKNRKSFKSQKEISLGYKNTILDVKESNNNISIKNPTTKNSQNEISINSRHTELGIQKREIKGVNIDFIKNKNELKDTMLRFTIKSSTNYSLKENIQESPSQRCQNPTKRTSGLENKDLDIGNIECEGSHTRNIENKKSTLGNMGGKTAHRNNIEDNRVVLDNADLKNTILSNIENYNSIINDTKGRFNSIPYKKPAPRIIDNKNDNLDAENYTNISTLLQKDCSNLSKSNPRQRVDSKEGCEIPIPTTKDKKGRQKGHPMALTKNKTTSILNQTKFLQINSIFINENKKLFLKKKVVIIVGAGISVNAGIPDFRSKNGLFNEIKSEYKIKGSDFFSIEFAQSSETKQIYNKFIAKIKVMCDNASPTVTHHFLNNFEKYSKKYRVYSQNIDGLERKAGMIDLKNTRTKLVLLHGNLKYLRCNICAFKKKFEKTYIQMFEEGKNPECEECIQNYKNRIKSQKRPLRIGLLQTSVVHYNETHPDQYYIGTTFHDDLQKANLIIIIGTSLKVHGVKSFLKSGLKKCNANGGKSVYVGLEEPSAEFKKLIDYFYKGDCDTFVSSISKSIDGNLVHPQNSEDYFDLDTSFANLSLCDPIEK